MGSTGALQASQVGNELPADTFRPPNGQDIRKSTESSTTVVFHAHNTKEPQVKSK